MRTTTSGTQTSWLSGDYTGTNRPMVRATIQRLEMLLLSYGETQYSSVCYGQKSKPLELPNIKDVKWQRSVDNGVATMTMTLYNTRPLPLGQTVLNGDLDQLGYYSPLRGNNSASSRWPHTSNGWQDWIVPDRIIRTYEGYGFNPAVIPELDTHLYQSGTWRIDDVEIKTDGTIVVTCRDVGSVLIDQIAFPPVVPFANYPLYFEHFHQVDNPDIVSTTGGLVQPAYSTSSNYPYVGNGSVHGHSPQDAFDSSPYTYWLSIGNDKPRSPYSFEYIEGKFSSRTITGIQFQPWSGPYRVYISVYAGGAGAKWQGDQTVPYDPNNPVSAPNFANIRFVETFTVEKNQIVNHKLRVAYKNATRIRVTFTNLVNSGIGPYPYRAGMRSLKVSTAVTTTRDGGTHTEPKTTPPGVADYTDIVKTFLAWAGFHWPIESTAAFTTRSDGATVVSAAPSTDVRLKSGRVWGDMEQTGTYPLAALGVQVWDKKPIMDCINYVRDIVGFISFVDEQGGFVFRSPNIWSVGNWIGNGGPNAGRTSTIVTIDEAQTLLQLGSKMSSRSIREKIFVANISGKIAAISAGHNPYPSGLRRVGGWTDQHFLTTAECQIMADLVALRQLFTYRTDKVTIPGNPAIQIDDQVRIYERQSEEGYLHYVTGISMSWSLETGKYTYDLDTHWLGDTTFTNWTFNPADLSAEAQAYLKSIGKI